MYMTSEQLRDRLVRLTYAWSEQGDPFPIDGPELETDMDTTVALDKASILAWLDRVPHEGFSFEDSYEEVWFDSGQVGGLLAELTVLLNEARTKLGAAPSPSDEDFRVINWLEAALKFTHEANRLRQGVCFCYDARKA